MESGLKVRPLTTHDRAVWLAMYRKLFADETDAALSVEIDRILFADTRWGYIAELAGKPVGFAEMSIRPFANGCVSQPVPFLEGIWADADARRAGVASALLAEIEAEITRKGYTELGSDVLLGNMDGMGFHEGSGFEETERCVYFRKSL